MSTWTERKVARALSERAPIEPPEGLLDKLKSEIPADVGSRLPATALREIRSAQVVAMPDRRMPRRQLRLLAASLILMLGGGLFALFVMRSGVSMEKVAEEDAAAPAAPSGAAAPAPRGAEPPDRAAEPVPASPPAVEEKRDQALRSLGYTSNVEEAPKEAERQLVSGDLPVLPESRRDAADEEDARSRVQAKAALPSASVAAPAPAPPPPSEPQADLAEEVEGGVEGGVAGGVVGGVPGGVVRSGARMEEAPRRPVVANEVGLDGDTASYTVARNDLREGRLPPREVIRVEEFVNHFSYGDPPPAQGDFALRAEGAPSIFTQEPRTYLLRFNLRAREGRTGTPQTIAEEAKMQVEFSPTAVARWRLIGSEGGGGTVDAGEIEAGQSVTALYEVQLTPRAAGKIASLHLRYQVPVTGELRENMQDLRVSDLVPKWENASPGFRLASLAAEFAETLRGSSHAGDLHKILRRARRVAGEMAGWPRAADVAEFVRLVETAARLQEKK